MQQQQKHTHCFMFTVGPVQNMNGIGLTRSKWVSLMLI